MGITRFAQNLKTEDERTARKRADLLWLHDWSTQIERAKAVDPHKVEDEGAFYAASSCRHAAPRNGTSSLIGSRTRAGSGTSGRLP